MGPVGAVRAVDISSDEEDKMEVFDPVIISRTSVEGRALLKWLHAARQRLGGVFPQPVARAQMDAYTQLLKQGKRKKKPKRNFDGDDEDFVFAETEFR